MIFCSLKKEYFSGMFKNDLYDNGKGSLLLSQVSVIAQFEFYTSPTFQLFVLYYHTGWKDTSRFSESYQTKPSAMAAAVSISHSELLKD